jgi:hypothetical protein
MIESDRANVFIERYKYVLRRKEALNEATFKIATIFQAGLIVLVAGQYAIVAAATSGNLDRDVARSGSTILAGMMVVLSVFALVLLISGAISWRSYNAEEKKFEEEVFPDNRSEGATLRIFRWYETYIAAAVLVIAAVYVGVVYLQILPMI